MGRPTDNLRAFYARQMEVYAGYSENADYNVGRVIDAIDELGELDNTVILWIWGDNGASMEGTVTGSFNELTMQNGIPLTDEMQLQLSERYGGLDEWGVAIMDPHYGAAWAWAGNTPFQWGKQVGAALGAIGGKALHNKIGSGIEKSAGETIPIGGAGLVVAYPHAAADVVEPAVTRAIRKAIGEAEGNHVKALKGALSDAQEKMAGGDQ